MSRDNAPAQILNVLEQLENKDLEKFLFQLQEPGQEPRIRAADVEDKSRVQVTKLLLSRCTEAGAVSRTARTLRDIGCNEEARGLEQWSKARAEKLGPSLRFSPCCVPGPSPEAQAVLGARSPLQELSVNQDPRVDQDPRDDQDPRVDQDPREDQDPRDDQDHQVDRPKDHRWALGRTTLVFDKHRGKSFDWLLENDVDYAVFLVATHQEHSERGHNTQDPGRMRNKDALAQYVSLFPHVMTEVHFYREGMAPLGLKKYRKLPLMDLYDSKEEEKKSYVQFLREMAPKCTKGSKMEAAIKYILHRDKHQPQTSGSHWPGNGCGTNRLKRSATKGRRGASSASKRRRRSSRN